MKKGEAAKDMSPEKQEKVIREGFCKLNVWIIGDVMVDEYVTGKVSRISPEAPIPVLNYGTVDRIAGGASNVAHNVAMLGSRVTMLGVVGDDAAGDWLKEHLQSRQILTDGLLTEAGRPTTVKRRFATKSQQLLRVDMENTEPIKDTTREKLLSILEKSADSIDAVILSDYQKGVLSSPDFVKRIIAVCIAHQIVITIDSKSSHIGAFAHATFVKPNNLELEAAAGIRITDDKSLNAAGERYLKQSGANALIVTRGAKGISVFEKGKPRKDYPSKAVQVYDVTGAGDTVISAATLGLTSGMTLEEAVILGNAAAGVVISKVGTVPVTAEELIAKAYDESERAAADKIYER